MHTAHVALVVRRMPSIVGLCNSFRLGIIHFVSCCCRWHGLRTVMRCYDKEQCCAAEQKCVVEVALWNWNDHIKRSILRVDSQQLDAQMYAHYTTVGDRGVVGKRLQTGRKIAVCRKRWRMAEHDMKMRVTVPYLRCTWR
jgi:hypothetical protein